VSPLREEEVVELAVLLPGWQAQALESAAHDQGMTVAQMLRSLLRDFIVRSGSAEMFEPAPTWE
jgi:hypothetical protein